MIIVDIQARTVKKDGKEIIIRSRLLFDILVYLADSNGMARTKSDIIEHCWESKIVTHRNVDVRICELRKIISDPLPGEVIQCVKSVGYKIVPGKVKSMNQNGVVVPKPRTLDGYAFIKNAKLDGKPVVILQNIKNVDDWIVIPKSEYIIK